MELHKNLKEIIELSEEDIKYWLGVLKADNFNKSFIDLVENLIARNKELEKEQLSKSGIYKIDIDFQDLAAYTNYLEEKLMYALGPKHKEFSDMTKCEFAKILKKAFDEEADTYTIKQNFKDFYNNM